MHADGVRPWLASLFSLVAFGFMFHIADRAQFMMLPAMMSIAAAALFHWPSMQAQLIARAAIWTPMLLNMLLAHLDQEAHDAVGMVVSGALALLAAGRITENVTPGSFQPIAYRKTLTLSLVLALADTLTLSMWTAFAVVAEAPRVDQLGFGLCAAVTLASAIGLYRLRMWGLVLGVIANVGIAIVFGAGIIEVQELRIVFIATAAAQLLVATPVIASVILRRPLELPAWLQTISRFLLPVALLGVIALALQPLFGSSILLRLATWLLH